MINEKKVKYFKSKLLNWFYENGRQFPWRDEYRSCYEIVIAEILLQRTKAETVSKNYLSFLDRFDSWETLAAATEDEIGESLKPLGLWRQRSKRMKALANEVVKVGQLPRSRKKLEALPMMGQYIVNAVLTQCYEKKEPFIDMNMVRVLERFFGPREKVDIRYDPYIQKLSKKVVYRRNHQEIIFLNWAILDFAASICKSQNPLCVDCPLKRKCNSINR